MPEAVAHDAESFAAALRTLREGAGLTQQELAERAGLTPHAISALERGTRTRPYPHTVRSLAEALGGEHGADSVRSRLIAAAARGRSSASPPPVDPAPDRAGTNSPGSDRPGTDRSGNDRSGTTLVVPPTTLYGRERDLRFLTDLLVQDETRLVTLTGPGGVGKTRLAYAAAAAVADHFPDGSTAVSLASTTEARAVLPTLARTLGLSGADSRDAYDQLLAHFRPRSMLILVDNLEHLLSAAPALADLAAQCPGLTVLATSRSPLRIRSEQEYAVAPLDLPPRAPATEAELGATAAGALLLDRARAVAALPVLDVDDLAACAELCHRLAGLPLAIELATAHLRLLGPRVLLDRLDEATASSAARDLPARQQTMRATLEWSLGLLSPAARQLFLVLGSFRGGATLEAIETVVARAEPGCAEDTLGLLHELVEHALLVVRADPDGASRFTMLEPVAQHARSLLVGADVTRVFAAHAAYGLGLAQEAALGLEGAEQTRWLAALEVAEPNLLIAIERSLEGSDPDTASLITWHLWLFWWLRGEMDRGLRMATGCLAAGPSPQARCRVALTAATMAFAAGDSTAAARFWAESDQIASELGDDEIIAKARAGVALAALTAGDVATATRCFEEALAHCAAAGPAGDWMTALIEIWLGTVLLLEGDPDSAAASVERGLVRARDRGDRLATYIGLYNLTQIAIARADYRTARCCLVEGITLSMETQDLANLAYFLEAVAVIDARTRPSDRAPTLLGGADRLRDQVGADVYAYYLPDENLRADAESRTREALGAAAFEEAFTAGTALDLPALVALATAIGPEDTEV